MITRLWSIQKKAVVDWQKASDIIISIKFSPDATKILVGLYKGKCLVYSINSNKLLYVASIDCKNRHGTYSDGRKVMGINFINNVEALVTTADSRLRILNLTVIFYKI